MAEVIKIKLSWSNVHLVLEDRPVLIDSGSPADYEKLLAALRVHGVNVKDLALILQTHGHADHAGCASRLHEASDAPVMVHSADAEMLRQGRNRPLKPTNLMGRLLIPLVDFPFPSLEPDIVLQGPLDLKSYGLSGQVLPLRGGHTAGSIAVMLENNQACVGDILLGGYLGGNLLPGWAKVHYFAEDVKAIRNELDMLIRAGVQKFFIGHGGPVSAQSVVKRLLKD